MYLTLISLIADLIQIGFFIWIARFWVIENFNDFLSWPIWIKAMVIIVLVIVTVRLIKDVTRLLEDVDFNTKLLLLNRSLKKQRPIYEPMIVEDYEKIIPQSDIFRHLYKRVLERTKKWSPDAYLHKINFSFNNYLSTGGINVNASFIFHSPMKKMDIKFDSPNLKLPKTRKITPSQLSHSEGNHKIKPFFKDKYWRKALITAFQRAERELIGKGFCCIVDSGIEPLWIQFMPKEEISRSIVFVYADERLYEGGRFNAPIIVSYGANKK